MDRTDGTQVEGGTGGPEVRLSVWTGEMEVRVFGHDGRGLFEL